MVAAPIRSTIQSDPIGARRSRRAPSQGRPAGVCALGKPLARLNAQSVTIWSSGALLHRSTPRICEFANCVHSVGRFSCHKSSVIMAIYLIQHRWTRRELAAIEAPSYTRALEWAARHGMSLMDVDLAGIELRGAFLAGADLRGSRLTGRRSVGLLSPPGRSPRGRPPRGSPRPCLPRFGRPSARRPPRGGPLSCRSPGRKPGRCRPPRRDLHVCPPRRSALRLAMERHPRGTAPPATWAIRRRLASGRRPGLSRRLRPLELAQAARRLRPPGGLGTGHPGGLGSRRR